MSLCSSTTGGDVHYVSSKPSSECLFLNVSERQHCKTLDEYAINYRDNSDSGGNSVTMMFLPGVHSLTGNFSIEGNSMSPWSVKVLKLIKLIFISIIVES